MSRKPQDLFTFQTFLFPWLEEELGPLADRHRALVRVLELVRVERWLSGLRGRQGRPRLSRTALARAFLAKPVFYIPTTRALRERLQVDAILRRLCGWEWIDGLPIEATFSRAFAEFAESGPPTRMHEALVRTHLVGHAVGHIWRDSTAIPMREWRERKADRMHERAAAAVDRPLGPFDPEPAEVGPESGETQPR